jgi:hypothetical protein
MPRRQANVNQADVQRIIRACQRENVPFRMTLQPNGAAVFEAANVETEEPEQPKRVGGLPRSPAQIDRS